MSTTINKALVALLGAAVVLANTFFNNGVSVSPETINTIAAVLTPVLVWLIPNAKA